MTSTTVALHDSKSFVMLDLGAAFQLIASYCDWLPLQRRLRGYFHLELPAHLLISLIETLPMFWINIHYCNSICTALCKSLWPSLICYNFTGKWDIEKKWVVFMDSSPNFLRAIKSFSLDICCPLFCFVSMIIPHCFNTVDVLLFLLFFFHVLH